MTGPITIPTLPFLPPLRRGECLRIRGDFNSGKSTVAVAVAAHVFAAGHRVALSCDFKISPQYVIDPTLMRAAKIRGFLGSPHLGVLRVVNGIYIDRFVASGAVDVAVVDLWEATSGSLATELRRVVRESGTALVLTSYGPWGTRGVGGTEEILELSRKTDSVIGGVRFMNLSLGDHDALMDPVTSRVVSCLKRDDPGGSRVAS